MRRPSRLLLHPLGCAWAITFVVLIAGWTAVASANTVSGPRETVRFDYTTRQVNSATGLTFDLSIRNPTDPSAAPVPLRKIVLVSPAGVRSDAQIPSCTASDMQMEFSGESACPTASKLATGTSVTRPLGGLPFTSDTAIFKTPDGQAMLIKFGNGGSAVVHTTIQGRIATTEVPTCLTGGQPPSGCPIDEDAVVDGQMEGVLIDAEFVDLVDPRRRFEVGRVAEREHGPGGAKRVRWPGLGEPLDAPSGEFEHRGAEGAALRCELVHAGGGGRRQRRAPDQPALLEVPKPGREQVAPDSREIGKQVGEAARAEHKLAHDQQRPSLAHHV